MLGVDEPAAALDICLRLKRRPLAPRVVRYADSGPDLRVPAALARADGIAHTSEPTADLLRVIRAAAAGSPALPPISPREQTTAAARLDAPDHAILAMTLAGTPAAEIATTLRLDRRELGRRTAAIVARLALPEQRPHRDRRSRRDGLFPAIGSRPASA